MIIANPLFDTAFKQLARDPEIAKAMMETLLETEVVKIDLSGTEHNKPLADDDKRPRFMRIDYCATIRDKNGAEQKILIEMQKGAGAENILRFRQYLAVAGYMPKPEEESPIPVVTVYFLGFKLQQVDTPCLKVARQYIDMLNKTVLETKEKFVELLTHDSYIIQAPRININKEPQTRLEKILSVFEQKNFVDSQEETINYKYPIDDSAVKKMADVLHYIGTDPDERKVLEEEAYWRRYDYHTAGALLRKDDELAEKDRELAEKDRELAEKGRELAEKGRELAEKGRELTEAKQQAEDTQKKFVLNMHEAGLSVDEIVRISKIPEAEVKKILTLSFD
jgi:hypothetical protein